MAFLDGSGDTFDGGRRKDWVFYSYAPGPVTVDLITHTGSVAGCPRDDVLKSVSRVKGGRFDDRLLGNARKNHLNGGNGNDFVLGRTDDDELEGGYGDDTLDGGPGTDTLAGGPGTDTCLNGEIFDDFNTCEVIGP